MSSVSAAQSELRCHAVQSESLLRAHSCSPKGRSGLGDAIPQRGTESRSPPPDKLDSHRLYIPTIHQENSEALTMIESACILPVPQVESSEDDEVTISAQASGDTLGEHRSSDKSLRASLEVEVATSKDEITLLRQQAAQDKEAIAQADRRAREAVAQLQREQQVSKKQMDSLTERIDALKDELSTTERLLASADDKLHSCASHSEQLQAVQRESKNMVGQEQARRRRAEVALEAAVAEVSTAQQGKTLAEMEVEKNKHMLELEVKLRQQISKEKDQVVQQLLEEQETVHALESRLVESDEALTAAAEEVAALRRHAGGDSANSSIHRVVDDLHERVCVAESGRRVAETAWQDAEEARLDALAARREAETAWQQASAILEREQNAHRLALSELLSERSARQLAQATLKRVNDSITARSAAAEPLTARTSGDVRASLLVEVKEERRGLGCLRSALVDVQDTQAEALRHVQDLQRCVRAHGLDSEHMHEIESARTCTEQGVRLAMVVLRRADEMLGHVSGAADATIRELAQGLAPHQMANPPLSARGRRSGDLGLRGHATDDDHQRWEVDSVFPDSYGLLDEVLDSQADSEALLGSEATRGALSGPPSGPHSGPLSGPLSGAHSFAASRESLDPSMTQAFSRGPLMLPGGPTPSPSRPLCSPAPSPRPFGAEGSSPGLSLSPSPPAVLRLPSSKGRCSDPATADNPLRGNATGGAPEGALQPLPNRAISKTPPGLRGIAGRPPAPRARDCPPCGSSSATRILVISNPTCPNSAGSPCIEASVEPDDLDSDDVFSCDGTPTVNENSPLLGNRSPVLPQPLQPVVEDLGDEKTEGVLEIPKLSPSEPPSVGQPAPGASGDKRPAVPKLALGSIKLPV